jgi:probable blue pigment (indigoidine) exporter
LLVGGPSKGGNWLGNILVLLSLVTMTGGILLNKRLMEHYPPLIATAYLFFFGTLMLVPASLLWNGLPTLDLPAFTLLSLVAQGVIFTALPYTLWNLGLSRVAASHAGIYSNIEPAAGAFFGVVFLKESLGPLALAGGLFVIGAAIIIALAPPAPTRATSDS